MNLEELRKDIDKIDNELKELFFKRMSVSKKIAELKKMTGDEIYKPDREKEVVARLVADVDDEIKPFYEEFIRNVMKISRDYQKSL